MTYGEGKKKALMLIDEYSSGGALTTDKDMEAKMPAFFDLAQKNICQYKRMVRSFWPDAEGVAPSDFGGVLRVWLEGRMTTRYRWRGKTILIPAAEVGRVEVEYVAIPATIPSDVKENYELEVGEDAAACMPYFVAAQQLMADLILDPAPLMEMYDRMVAALDMRLPSGGGGGIRQGFYS